MDPNSPPKIFYVGIIDTNGNPVRELAAAKDLSYFNMLARHSTGEFMTLFARTVAESTKVNQRQDVSQDSFTFHASKQVPVCKARKGEGCQHNRPGVCDEQANALCGIVITNHTYPMIAAHKLLGKVLDEFFAQYPKDTWSTLHADPEKRKVAGKAPLPEPMPQLNEYVKKYKDPQQIDSLSKIQQELDATKVVLHETIESVLQRGEKLDDLVAKSNDLSSSSRLYYQRAKGQNRCCTSM